jgi:hypothetical protein
MQEAKRYEVWHIKYTMPYEVLNVANMASGRQAWRCLDALQWCNHHTQC